MRDNLIRFGLLAALALVWGAPLMLSSQAASVPTDISAGNSAAIGSAGQPGSDTPQAKILDNALSSDTRNTLQQAMDSAGAGN
jgi:hypothetical protein